MQHLCLCGPCAPLMAEQLFRALNLSPVGLHILPFPAEGSPRGDAIHLQPPPDLNGVPCRIRLTREETVIVPRALEEVAAPGIRAALRIHTPLLLSGLSADLLACPVFRQTVCDALMGARPVVVAADASAREALEALLPPHVQLWLDVPADEDGRAALLEALLPEAALRF